MRLNQLKEIYESSPLWLKSLVGRVPDRLKFGKDYFQWREMLKDGKIDLEVYEFEKLKESLSLAWRTIPSYKRHWASVDFHPEDFTSTRLLEGLPFIDKEWVKQNLRDTFDSKRGGKGVFEVTTGGSSGEQMHFLQSANVWWKELAFVHKAFGVYGYQPGTRKASFRGGAFSEGMGMFRENPIYNELCFSPFHLSLLTVKEYVARLNSEQIAYFHGYPSAILALANLMVEMKLALTYKVKAIFLISENFSLEQVRFLEEYFKCSVMSFYGHTERLIFAPSHKEVNHYKVDKLYGYLELVNTEGGNIECNGAIGEMVGTSFDNFSMPLIRYKCGDYTSYLDVEAGIINGVRGRWGQATLVGYGGEQVTLTALNVHTDIFSCVSNYQYEQVSIGEVNIRVIPNLEFDEGKGELILEALQEKVSGLIHFKLCVVSEMFLTPRGKYKRVVNRLK